MVGFLAVLGSLVYFLRKPSAQKDLNRERSSQKSTIEETPLLMQDADGMIPDGKGGRKKSIKKPVGLGKLPAGWKDFTGDASCGSVGVQVAAFSEREDYGKLSKNDPSPDELPGSVTDLSYANRYRNVLPNGHSRVPLEQIGDNPLTCYINANFVRGFDASPNQYIASQGPLPETTIDFWRMIWEQNSSLLLPATSSS